MEPADHMDFSYALSKRLLDCLLDLIDSHFESVRITLTRPESAKLTRKNADIRIVDISVQDISRAVPVLSFRAAVGDQPKPFHVVGTKKLARFRPIDPFARRHFIVDLSQRSRQKAAPLRAGYLGHVGGYGRHVVCEIFHKPNLTQK